MSEWVAHLRGYDAGYWRGLVDGVIVTLLAVLSGWAGRVFLSP